jgi:hypothetical protein
VPRVHLTDRLPRSCLVGWARAPDARGVHGLGRAAPDVRHRRVQQDTFGHRGRAGDPLYDVRRLLRRRRDRLAPRAWARLQAGLLAGDPTGEVTLAWTVAQDLMALYQRPDPAHARQRAQTLIADLRGCPIPSWPGSAAPCTPGATSCARTSPSRP